MKFVVSFSILLSLIVSSYAYANMQCVSLFSPERPSEAEITKVIEELHKLILEMYSADSVKARVAKDLFNKKLENLSEYMPIKEIEILLTEIKDLNPQIRKETQQDRINKGERVSDILTRSKLEIFLKEHGFKGLDDPNENGDYPIIKASVYEEVEFLEVLISGKVNLEKQSKDGRTALMQASVSESIKVLEKLLAAGADKEKQDNKGKTA